MRTLKRTLCYCLLIGTLPFNSGLVFGEEQKPASPESVKAQKIIETQQKNREIMQKTVRDALSLAPNKLEPSVKPEASRGSALPPKSAIVASQPPPTERSGPNGGGRDPFTTSMLMYQVMGQQSTSGAGRSFVPSLNADGVPKMKLKGIINNGPKMNATALLDVEGAGVFLVRSGDEIGLQGIGRNQVLKIVKVDALKVEVQAGQINQVIIVR